jgi:hypothetical protein
MSVPAEGTTTSLPMTTKWNPNWQTKTLSHKHFTICQKVHHCKDLNVANEVWGAQCVKVQTYLASSRQAWESETPTSPHMDSLRRGKHAPWARIRHVLLVFCCMGILRSALSEIIERVWFVGRCGGRFAVCRQWVEWSRRWAWALWWMVVSRAHHEILQLMLQMRQGCQRPTIEERQPQVSNFKTEFKEFKLQRVPPLH